MVKVWKLKGASGTEWTLAIGAHAAPGAAWAAGVDALWVVKKGTATYEEEVAYLDENLDGVANLITTVSTITVLRLQVLTSILLQLTLST